MRTMLGAALAQRRRSSLFICRARSLTSARWSQCSLIRADVRQRSVHPRRPCKLKDEGVAAARVGAARGVISALASQADGVGGGAGALEPRPCVNSAHGACGGVLQRATLPSHSDPLATARARPVQACRTCWSTWHSRAPSTGRTSGWCARCANVLPAQNAPAHRPDETARCGRALAQAAQCLACMSLAC